MKGVKLVKNMVMADRTAEIRVSMWEGAAINTDHLGDNDHFDKNIISEFC